MRGQRGALVERSVGSPTVTRRFERARKGLGMIAAQVRLHPRPFTLAVAGTSVFALCTVASALAVEWVIDHVILPRFEEGDVAAGTVAAGVGLIILIGFVRAVGVVVRRTSGRQDAVARARSTRPRCRRPAHPAADLVGASADPTATSSVGPASTLTPRSGAGSRAVRHGDGSAGRRLGGVRLVTDLCSVRSPSPCSRSSSASTSRTSGPRIASTTRPSSTWASCRQASTRASRACSW